jgi:hypothetical protein
VPTSAAATRSVLNECATASMAIPMSVKTMPAGSEYGIGRRSVWSPTRGCRSEAVHW